jgi:predicted nucleotidyltransferase
MNLNELYNLNLSDTVRFHNELNPAIFQGDSMIPEVRSQLLVIAEDFVDHLGLNHLAIEDITVSGSSAAYSYTPFSDIDLHILVDMNQFKDDDVYRELFDAKKNVYNDSHDITIGGYEVELYVQDTNMPVVSLGEYSVLNDKWIRLPRKRRAHFDQAATKIKYQKLMKLAEYALKSGNYDRIQGVLRTLKKYRKAGLDKHGEFGPENLAYKALRNSEIISRLYNKLDELHSQQLSLPESTEDTSLVDELAEGWQNYIQECSGYIPSEEERNDPRWKMGLSVDITPNSIKDNARKLGSKIQRNGRPPLLRP